MSSREGWRKLSSAKHSVKWNKRKVHSPDMACISIPETLYEQTLSSTRPSRSQLIVRRVAGEVHPSVGLVGLPAVEVSPDGRLDVTDGKVEEVRGPNVDVRHVVDLVVGEVAGGLRVDLVSSVLSKGVEGSAEMIMLALMPVLLQVVRCRATYPRTMSSGLTSPQAEPMAWAPGGASKGSQPSPLVAESQQFWRGFLAATR